jgi:hypothetical protein
MRVRKNLAVLFFLIFASYPFNARASNLSWLDVDPNVRSAAMGGCGVATSLDPDAAALNPALLSWLPSPTLCLMHNQWFGDQILEHAGFGLPLPKGLGAALLLDYADLGSVQGNRVGSDGYVYPTETYQPRGFRVGGGFSKRWGAFGLGAVLHGVFESGFTEDQSGLLWGTGLAYHPDRGLLSAGLYLQGASGQASGGSHKVECRPALAAHLGKDDRSSFIGTLEGVFGGDNLKGSVKLGAEYAYLSRYFVRGGYRWFADSSELVGLRGLTVGLGWRSNTWGLNYAMTSMGTLGIGHQFSLQIYLAKSEAKKTALTPQHPNRSKKASTPTKTPAPRPIPMEEPTATPTPTAVEGDTSSSSKGEMMDWYKKGAAANQDKRYGSAIRYYEEAVAIQDPTVKDFYYAEAYSTLGSLYHHHRSDEDHFDQARKYYLKALKIDRDTESAKKGLELLDAAGK